MSTKEEGGQARWAKVATPLQYLALTNRQLLIFYGSVITVGSAMQRPLLVGFALFLAGLPQLSMLLLSAVNRDALKALGQDASKNPELQELPPAAAGAPRLGTGLGSEVVDVGEAPESDASG
jgi:hypothetical protein